MTKKRMDQISKFIKQIKGAAKCLRVDVDNRVKTTGLEKKLKKTAIQHMLLILVLIVFSACTQVNGIGIDSSVAPAIDRVVQKGNLVVATAASMPPLNMTTRKGEIVGLEIDIARLMAAAMGVKLKLEAMPFSELLPALEAGKVDMIISGMTITPKRNLKVAFVGPYFISGKSILTKSRTLASVKDAAEINQPGTTLAALKGSTSQSFVETLIPKATLVRTQTYDEAVSLVLQDKVHALIADFPICIVSTFRYPNRGLTSLITPFTYEPLGIALPANDPLLVNWVENFLRTLKGSGTLKKLEARWFKDASWLSQLP